MRSGRMLMGLGALTACLAAGLGTARGQQAPPALDLPAGGPPLLGAAPGGPPLEPVPTGPAPVLRLPPVKPKEASTPPPAPRTDPPPAPVEKAPASDDAAAFKDLFIDAKAGPNNDNPTGRQEPAVSLEWVGPPLFKVGEPAIYQLVVRNIGPCRAHRVEVRARLPKGVTVKATEPKASAEGDLLLWKLGALEVRQEVRLDMQMVTVTTGSLPCQAYVTLTGASVTRLEAREPKLSVRITPPAKPVVGDLATVTLLVSNPGDAPTEAVKVRANLSDGLDHLKGKSIEFDLGTLAAGETRTVLVPCGARQAGRQSCTAAAVGAPGLKSRAEASFEVLCPKLELAVTGPGLRYLDRHGVVVFHVKNPGTAPAEAVTLSDQVPPGFKVVTATANGRYDFVTRTVSWALGRVDPGKDAEVRLELSAINPGVYKNQAQARALRGLHAEGELVTRVEGLPALLMELVDVDDPVEVGADTSYEVRITNTGTKTETNVQLTCTLPPGMTFRGVKAPSGCHHHVSGRDVVFDVVPRLAPRADVIYRVQVRGKEAGDLRFQARVRADGLALPVLKEESTRVYGDEVETHATKGSEPKAPRPESLPSSLIPPR